MSQVLLTISEAAKALGVSESHIKRLIYEADSNCRARWRWGRELINLSPAKAARRVIRININAITSTTAS
jgi:DNA-binding Lrp family transcriptional regulator